jgi:hypothetical protein
MTDSDDGKLANPFDVIGSSVSLIAVIGFHHSKGHAVEWTYPEMPKVDWKHLTFTALPEVFLMHYQALVLSSDSFWAQGAHNFEGLGHVFFTIELTLAGDAQPALYFGTAVFGQVSSRYNFHGCLLVPSSIHPSWKLGWIYLLHPLNPQHSRQHAARV